MKKIEDYLPVASRPQQAEIKCEIHGVYKLYFERTDETLCPKCQLESRAKFAEDLAIEQFQIEKERKRQYFLYDFSLMDKSLSEATFDNFRTDTKEQADKLEFAKRIGREYIKGARNNVIFRGDVGVGKSHLAFSIIKAVSDHTKEMAIFVNVVDLLSRIKSDFSAENDYIYRLCEAKYLVLDDLGMEKVSEWSIGILYNILNKRENTIITTNLTAQQIRDKYGHQIFSRAFKGVDENHVAVFEKMEDQRLTLF